MYGIPTEPPLQRKKKPIPLTTTATTKYINGEYESSGQRVEDEYTLIGDQTKFGQSIKYRNLKNDRRKALAKTFNVGGKRQAARLKNGTSSDEPGPAPAPKVNVDTGKPRVPPAPAIKSAPPPPPPTKSKPPPPQRPPPPKVQIDTGKKEPLRERREGMMNEFVQTDMEKGVADSGQEVPPDYAMKYRAGVPPPRPKNPKRVSEYQKEFSWKKPVESVPLLQAEQVVYNSSMDLPPYKSDNIPRTTEYNNQFKPWTDFYKPVEPKKSENGPEGGRKKHKMKRSKSEAELRLSPDKRPPAGIHQVTSPDDKRLVKESLNPQRIFFPHGKYRNYRSEYHSNFRPPWKYTYEDGAWRGANPPHIMPVKENESDAEAGQQPPPPSPGANWFAEVVELRKKAEEYRKRAQGTHFSREHLAQLLAQQAELWDQVSESSTLSALSLEQPAKKHRRKENKENEQPRESKRAARPPPPQGSEPVRRKLAWEKSEEDERASGIGSIASPEGTLTSGSMSDNEGTLGADDDDDEGRIPTPRLRVEQVQRQSNVQRHHLDRTTPAVGGALLTSPPPRKRTPRKTPPQSQKSQPQSQPSRGRRVSSSTSSSSTMSNQPPRKEGVSCSCGASTSRVLPPSSSSSSKPHSVPIISADASHPRHTAACSQRNVPLLPPQSDVHHTAETSNNVTGGHDASVQVRHHSYETQSPTKNKPRRCSCGVSDDEGMVSTVDETGQRDQECQHDAITDQHTGNKHPKTSSENVTANQVTCGKSCSKTTTESAYYSYPTSGSRTTTLASSQGPSHQASQSADADDKDRGVVSGEKRAHEQQLKDAPTRRTTSAPVSASQRNQEHGCINVPHSHSVPTFVTATASASHSARDTVYSLLHSYPSSTEQASSQAVAGSSTIRTGWSSSQTTSAPSAASMPSVYTNQSAVSLPHKSLSVPLSTLPASSQGSCIQPPAVNGSSPTFGMPTRDSHMLIDDSVSYDRGMETKYVHSPQPSKARRDRPNSGSMHGRPMTAMPQKRQPQQPPNYPSPIPEQMGKTYVKPTLEALKAQERLGEWKKQDDDTLSTSTRSLASSCSLASEVLERARSRRDEFWGKQPGETGKENRAR
ncbi:serine/arginine repetitive matrix protein 1 [Lingula anatina]|uniref:Nuclear protein MDM1 n=1 Tax=Lingula anatina TaxID=7574 RepID=A0A1S3H0L5_LINAN|nr:serine/arginine repetitive matrix protein 1 [Lingula anatina]|eukprot:XP_013379477.1 serine/arginine repetitive matrix protein 1 [Lingula anatina]